MVTVVGPEKNMGRFTVDVELANSEDLAAVRLGQRKSSEVRRVHLECVVDSGASRLVLPQKIADQLGLAAVDHVKVRYANNRTAKRPQVEGVYLKLQGRHGVFKATLEPKRETGLLGAIVLEDLDFVVDCTKGQVYPRDPKFVINEIE